MNPVPVLIYHHVNPHWGDTVTITPETFAGQMEYLHRAGFRTLTVEQLLQCVKDGVDPSPRTVLLTFDDGWLDNYIYAYPVLKRYGMNGAFFLITDRVEASSSGRFSFPSVVPCHEESKGLISNGEARKVVLNWDLVQEMAEEGLSEFYSHTRSHRRCDLLTPAELLDELGTSKGILEERLSRPCPYLCWPYGKYAPLAERIARETGYTAIFTTNEGFVTSQSNPFRLERVMAEDDVEWLEKLLTRVECKG